MVRCASRLEKSDSKPGSVLLRSLSLRRTVLSSLLWVFVTKYRIELNPCYVGVCDIGEMASRTFGHRLFRGGLIVGQWVMPEGEEAPAVGLSKTLAVFHRFVDAVELAVEISPSGWFGARAVWKSRF